MSGTIDCKERVQVKMKSKGRVSPVSDGSITTVPGIRASGIHSGLKKEKEDLALFCSDTEAVAAGVFTRNLVQAAPVLLCRERIGRPVRAIVVNSGNANACTGEEGMRNAREMARLTGEALGITPSQVLVCSTGVIGRQLPMPVVRAGIAHAATALTSGQEGGRAAARAILTTDLFSKEAVYRVDLPGGSTFYLAGMAKGAGMIAPDMATMLAFLVTDAQISSTLLGAYFRRAVDNSFNLITVDGDTSTNDSAIILANGVSGLKIVAGELSGELFQEALQRVCLDLAGAIVRDGEGTTKVIALTIKGAPDREAARILAMRVLNSPLVKTSFYGEDANWGRILSALGTAGIQFDPSLVDIYLGSVQVAAAGAEIYFSETAARAVLSRKEIPVVVDLKAGETILTAWGADLSHDYVSINSHYRS